MSMKKFSIFLAILSAVLLTACNNGGSESESSSGSTVSTSSVIESSSASTTSSSADEKKADLYANEALNAVEFPKMKKVETPEEIDAFFEFNTANYADFSLYMNVMSVNLNRVIIVKPLDGKHDEVFAELKAYFDDLLETGAYYPAQESSAAGAVMGETEDGYIYIIVHENGEAAAQEIVKTVG